MWRAKEQERQRHMWSMKWQSPVPGKPVYAGEIMEQEKEEAEALGPSALLF